MTGLTFIHRGETSVSHFNGRSVNAHTFDINDLINFWDPFFFTWVAFATCRVTTSVEKTRLRPFSGVFLPSHSFFGAFYLLSYKISFCLPLKSDCSYPVWWSYLGTFWDTMGHVKV